MFRTPVCGKCFERVMFDLKTTNCKMWSNENSKISHTIHFRLTRIWCWRYKHEVNALKLTFQYSNHPSETNSQTKLTSLVVVFLIIIKISVKVFTIVESSSIFACTSMFPGTFKLLSQTLTQTFLRNKFPVAIERYQEVWKFLQRFGSIWSSVALPVSPRHSSYFDTK